MRTNTVRIGLSLMVVLSFNVDRLPAQVVTMAPGGEQILVVPTVPYEPAYIPTAGSPFAFPPPPPPGKHRLQTAFNQHGMCCESNTPWGACGNFWYDYYFIFGSCRSFFGEPCYPHKHGNHANPYWPR